MTCIVWSIRQSFLSVWANYIYKYEIYLRDELVFESRPLNFRSIWWITLEGAWKPVSRWALFINSLLNEYE